MDFNKDQTPLFRDQNNNLNRSQYLEYTFNHEP